jgi:ribosomal protein L11
MLTSHELPVLQVGAGSLQPDAGLTPALVPHTLNVPPFTHFVPTARQSTSELQEIPQALFPSGKAMQVACGPLLVAQSLSPLHATVQPP